MQCTLKQTLSNALEFCHVCYVGSLDTIHSILLNSGIEEDKGIDRFW